MLISEFEKIQNPTWIRVNTPSDPFVQRVYMLITHVKRRIPKGGTDDSKHEAYVYFYSEYAPSNWAGAGWRTKLPGKYWHDTFREWDIKHMSLVKAMPSKTKRGFMQGIFSPRDYK